MNARCRNHHLHSELKGSSGDYVISTRLFPNVARECNCSPLSVIPILHPMRRGRAATVPSVPQHPSTEAQEECANFFLSLCSRDHTLYTVRPSAADEDADEGAIGSVEKPP
ncbi:hypothetical protein CEXT_356441 [Caerostris extrusa]|uniref:Uncharacterized protein n=1 Tax=Caerostris extrusa TaxID=172846 RepID=A0AAV4XSI1_CAEEX|nr:hypothetical protein CEXT_356441 [Caerostris extrusa]